MAGQTDALTIPKSLLRRAAMVVYAILGVIVIALIVVAIGRTFGSKDTLASAINTSEYQAVFLTSGQIYFGKLTAPGGDFYYLRDIYYLQSQVSPQSGKAVRQTLVKLGNEIHGPEDLMVINRQQILFVENLKPTGRVSRAIAAAHGGP